MEQYMPIVWIGFAIFMLFCEGFTTQLVSIWFVLGSVCAAITTIFTSDITIQSAVFLAVSLVSLIVTRPLVKRFKKRNKTTGTNADPWAGGAAEYPRRDGQAPRSGADADRCGRGGRRSDAAGAGGKRRGNARGRRVSRRL